MGGGGAFHGGYDALDFRLLIRNGDAGKLGIFLILSNLPDKFAIFLFEFRDLHFQRLNLPPLPDDRSTVNVHAIITPDQIMFRTVITLLNCSPF